MSPTAGARFSFGDPLHPAEILHTTLQAMMLVSARSMTHFRRCLDLYRSVLFDFMNKDDEGSSRDENADAGVAGGTAGPHDSPHKVRSAIVVAVLFFWRFHKQRAVAWVRELLARGIVSRVSVMETLLKITADDNFCLHCVDWPHCAARLMPQDSPVYVPPGGQLFRSLLLMLLRQIRYDYIRAFVGVKRAQRRDEGGVAAARAELDAQRSMFAEVTESLCRGFLERGLQGAFKPDEVKDADEEDVQRTGIYQPQKDCQSLLLQLVAMLRRNLPLLERQQILDCFSSMAVASSQAPLVQNMVRLMQLELPNPLVGLPNA